MKPKLNLLGFLLIIVGGVTSAVLPAVIYISAPLFFIGVFLFVGIYSEDAFIDYITLENDNYVCSIRKRSYYHFLPFDIILNFFNKILSIFKININIKLIYKVDYYKIVSPSPQLENINPQNIADFKVSNAEYKQLLDNQKQQYLNKTVPQEIVADICVGKATKRRFMIPLVIALIITLSGLTVITEDPSAIYLIPIYDIPLGWLTILRYLEYKEEKFKKSVYDSYFSK